MNSREPLSIEGSLFLHSFRRCPFAIRVRMVLEEKGIPYSVLEENLANPSEALLQMHPEGRVPLLVHVLSYEKRILFQSSVITEYLEDFFSSHAVTLMPLGAWHRARIRLWTYECDQIFKPDLDLYKYELASLENGAKAALLLRLQNQFLKWDSELKDSPFFLGEALSLADIHLFPFVRQFFAIKNSSFDLQTYPHLSRWLHSILERNSFHRVMERRN